jgi:hypothetical protein
MTAKPKLIMKKLHNLDLQNTKELKHCSSSIVSKIHTMEILANLKYSKKELASTLDIERVRHRCMKGFKLVI